MANIFGDWVSLPWQIKITLTFLPYSRLVSTLISYGADIKSRNYVLWTPLDCAAAYGQQKCAKILLDANADINPMDRNKVTPLHLAAKYGHEHTVKLLIGSIKYLLIHIAHFLMHEIYFTEAWNISLTIHCPNSF